MRHILFLLFMAFTLQAIAQYPATGNKMRLGWQTTGDGLVYRGAIGDTATLDPSGINNAWMLLDTANGNLYAYRAKAWRLVSGGGGGGGLTMPFDSVTFNVNETDASLRELKYSEEKGYLQYGGQDSVQIPLLPGIWYVRNDTSVTIPKGTVLRATGTLGASGRIKVKHMIANGSIDAMYILGIAMQDIAVGADGYAMSQGKIRKINTQAYSEGAVLYADVDTLGGLTQTEPTGSNLKLPIAFVVNSASNGTIAVRVTSGAYMRDLHDAEITSPASNASLYYNAAQGIWRDTTAAVLTSDTSVFARDFQISGTTNRLAMFTGSNTVGNSIVTQNGRSMYINSTQDNSAFSLSNSFQFNGFGSNNTDQPSIGVFGNTGTNPGHRPYLAMYRSFGDTANSKTLVPYNSYLGSIVWHGADGVNLASRGAEIGAITDSITGVTDMPTALFFGTTTNGAASPTERMRITSPGNVGINTTIPAHRLDVNGDVNTTGVYRQNGTNIISGTTNYIPKFTGANTVGNSGFIENGQEVYLGGTTNAFNFSRFSIYYNPRNNGFPIVSDTRSYATYTGAGDLITPSGGWSFGGKYNSSDELTAFASIQGKKEDLTQSRKGSMIFSTNDDTPGDLFPKERMRITSAGNVGIATSSPSRPLHVAGTTAIRIPVGTTSDRGTSANGDIRYNTTNANFEWHTGTAWREPVNAARSPNTVGIANRFSKFDANGLLDTSAILIQANNRIGIFNSPAAGDSALTVTGGIRATRDMYARRYNVSTFTGQVLSINNYAPAGSPGFNIFMGNGGENLNWANGENASYNIGIGFNSLLRVTTAQGNIGIGVDACRNITSGINNIAIGVSSLANTTIANDNFGLGAGTLFRNTIGSSNTAIGNYALLNGVTASSNTGIGLNALYNNTGNNNVGIGTEVLFYQTAASNNSAFGYQAGSRTNIGSNNETSSNSIYIGYDTRASTSGNQNEIVIGYQGRGNGSNTTTIGNSSTTATILPAGRLGIAITSPTAHLHLPAGTASANTAPLKFTSGTNLTTPEAGVVEWNGTNVFVTNSSATRQTVNQGLTGSATIDFASTNAQNSRDVAITITGASDGDAVSLGVPNAAVNANTCYTAWVSAANTVTVRFNNYSSGAVDPASATFKVFVTKF